MDKKSAGARELLESMFRTRGRRGPSRQCAAAAPARAAVARTSCHPRRRQGRRLDDASRGTALCSNCRRSGSPGSRVTRHGYGRPTQADPGHRSGSSGPGQDRRLGGETRAGARRRGGCQRSCPRVALRWCVGKLDRASSRAHARGKAGRHPRAVKERRQYWRDERGPKTPLAHQGRPPCQACSSGQSRDAGDFRRAGRRPGGDRLRTDRARSDDTCGRARDREPLPSRTA